MLVDYSAAAEKTVVFLIYTYGDAMDIKCFKSFPK